MSLNICSLCMESKEKLDHSQLQYSLNLKLWNSLFKMVNVILGPNQEHLRNVSYSIWWSRFHQVKEGDFKVGLFSFVMVNKVRKECKDLWREKEISRGALRFSPFVIHFRVVLVNLSKLDWIQVCLKGVDWLKIFEGGHNFKAWEAFIFWQDVFTFSLILYLFI